MRWRLLIAGLVLGLAGSAAQAGVKTISGVPSYIWYKGCGPTAAGMIIGYWDANGYPNLITAGDGTNSWTTNQQAVKDMIASPGHISDYYDKKPDAFPPTHSDDCVADFMGASRDPLNAGESYENWQVFGLEDYAKYRGYASASGLWYSVFGGLWTNFVAEIDAGRPVELFVDSNADGTADHFVTAFGYDDTTTPAKYACYNTYNHDVQWYNFEKTASGKSYGITSATFFTAPEPGSVCLLLVGAALAGLAGRLRRRQRA